MADQSKWSSGEPWTRKEEERLRLLYLRVLKKMPGRSEAAVFSRLERLRVANYHTGWPDQPLV